MFIGSNAIRQMSKLIKTKQNTVLMQLFERNNTLAFPDYSVAECTQVVRKALANNETTKLSVWLLI